MEVSTLAQSTTECTAISQPLVQEISNINNTETHRQTVTSSLSAISNNNNNNASSSSDEIVSRTCKKPKKREKSPSKLDLKREFLFNFLFKIK